MLSLKTILNQNLDNAGDLACSCQKDCRPEEEIVDQVLTSDEQVQLFGTPLELQLDAQ